jgi:carbonic anhydrase
MKKTGSWLPYVVASAVLGFSSPALSASAPAWTYDSDSNGQEEWGMLSPEYADCEIGTQQSPITITQTEMAEFPPLISRYGRTTLQVRNTGNALIAEVGGNLTLINNNISYTLKQIIIHSPSEHIIRNRFYPAEFHLFHESADGKKLMLAVFAESRKEDNGPLHKLLEATPSEIGKSVNVEFDPTNLLPSLKGYYTYPGSLTMPPCKEGIEWIVLKNTIGIGKPQLALIGQRTGRNARLTQPVYLRTVKETRE